MRGDVWCQRSQAPVARWPCYKYLDQSGVYMHQWRKQAQRSPARDACAQRLRQERTFHAISRQLRYTKKHLPSIQPCSTATDSSPNLLDVPPWGRDMGRGQGAMDTQ